MRWLNIVWAIVVALLKTPATKNTTTTPKPGAPVPRRIPRPFLETLLVEDATPLREADYITVATRLRCEWQALAAVAEVESGHLGAFGEDGRPIILFERHLFARKTNNLYNLSHPMVSQPRAGGYPATQVGRWRQLAEAYALHPEAALESTSWGRFQVLGQNFVTLNMGDAATYVRKLARSERDQLDAFEAFIVANDLAQHLRTRNWPAFARRYNGADYARNRYDQRMAEAYARLKGRGVVA